ncbi:MAG: glycosyltransferase family 4 protein [Myxococcales bacterium]|nr:glycosyltransferase family 4 protein [Myxococcales bacterium]
MRLVITSEYHFTHTSEGVFADALYGYDFWSRYLEVFSDVVVIARSGERGGSAADQAATATQLRVTGPGVRACLLPSVRGASLLQPGVVAAVVRAAREAFEQPAALLFRAPGVVPLLMTPLVPRARALGVQVVGDPQQSLRSAGMAGAVAAPMLARHLSWLVARADATLYVTAEALQRRYPPNAAKPTFSASDLDLPAELWGAPPPPQGAGPAMALIFVGMLDREYKGLDVLLRALAMAAAAHTLTVVGDGLLRAQYEHLALTLGLGTRVRWRGALPSGAAVHGALAQHELFVLPSRTEGMPRVLLEAMAVGLPCIATPVGGVPEVLGEEALVPVGDAMALASRLDAWGAAPWLRQQQATRNRAYALPFEQSARDARLLAFWRALRAAAIK